ncbi:MAG: hypothetical protein RL757_2597, partial [Bacteroidota bacterium]
MKYKKFPCKVIKHKTIVQKLVREHITQADMLRKNTYTHRFLQTIFLFLLSATMSWAAPPPGPCGMAYTVTNTSHPFAADGVITVTGITGTIVELKLVNPDGSAIMLANDWNFSNATRFAYGLVPGNYSLVMVVRDAGWLVTCSTTTVVTVGSTAFPTCATTEIGGYVYQDFNANGTREAKELGVIGTTVSAYNTANTLVATAISAESGWYKLTGLTAGQQYRLEFRTTDNFLKPGSDGVTGSTIQFAAAGSCNVNAAFNFPDNYCQTDNPYIGTACYVNGTRSVPAIANMDAFVSFPYKAFSTGDVSTQSVAPTHVATA